MNQADFAKARELVASRLGPLGVRFVRQIGPDGQPFGNAIADFDAPRICFRLVFDRGDLYLQTTSPGELDQNGESSHWYPLEGLLEFLGAGSTPEAPTLSTLGFELEYAIARWADILRLFAEWAVAKPRLDAFLRRRFEALINNANVKR